MRRRIRSAAVPVHRHSLPQLLVDGLLVALAYFLAYRLRFDGGFRGLNHRYGELLGSTIAWVVPGTLVALAAFGVYQRLWTFVGQRDYEAVVKGVIVATVVLVGAITLFHPIQPPAPFRYRNNTFRLESTGDATRQRDRAVPAAEPRAARRRALPRPSGRRGPRSQLPRREGSARRPDRRGRQGGRLVARELIRNPQLRLRPVGFVDDDPRKRGIKDEYGLRVLGTTTAEDLDRILDEVEPDEVLIAIPSAPGTLRARW